MGLHLALEYSIGETPKAKYQYISIEYVVTERMATHLVHVMLNSNERPTHEDS
jgi:hypothetical protein